MGVQEKKEGKKKENKEEKEKKEKKKKTKAVLKCKSGHPLTQRPPEDSGWFCSASKDSGGCRRALAEKAVASGGISSSRFPFADSRSEMSKNIFPGTLHTLASPVPTEFAISVTRPNL